MKSNKLYVIDWYLNGVVKETINLNNPTNKTIAIWKIDKLISTTHRTGKLIPRCINP